MQFTKIYSLKIWFKHLMVIRKIGIVNFHLVKGNFPIRKRYHFKLSTSQFVILNFQL